MATANPAISPDLGSTAFTLWQRVLAYFFTFALIALAFWVAFARPYTPGSNLGYYLGLVGGCMMLVLLLYPLRKRWSRFHHLGSMRLWFFFHALFGVLGPILVIFHTTFTLRSFNASVAFWSMVAVLASGLTGRFLYVYIYKGLGERHSTLYDLEGFLESNSEKAAYALHLAPHAMQGILEFRRRAFSADHSVMNQFMRFAAVAWQRQRVTEQAQRQVRRILRIHAKANGWRRARYVAEARRIYGFIEEYARAVDLASQHAFWERLMAWWQMAHVPVVYLLTVSAIAHVVAAHMY